MRDLEIDFLDICGRPRPVEFNATAISTTDGARLLCLCHDITNRVQTRRELEDARDGLERPRRTPHRRTRPRQRADPLPRPPAGIRRRPRPPRPRRGRPGRTHARGRCHRLQRAGTGVQRRRRARRPRPRRARAARRPRLERGQGRPARRHDRPRLPERLRPGQPRAGGLRGPRAGAAFPAHARVGKHRHRQRHDRGPSAATRSPSGSSARIAASGGGSRPTTSTFCRASPTSSPPPSSANARRKPSASPSRPPRRPTTRRSSSSRA